jgi:hypothetical protein
MERLKNTISQEHGVVLATRPGIEDDEFVSSDSTHDTLCGKNKPKTLCNCHKNIISSRMAKTVIDVLESVNINEQNCWLSPISPRCTQRSVDMLEHEAAVGETSQRVGLRTGNQTLLKRGVRAHGKHNPQQYGASEYQDGSRAHHAITRVLSVSQCKDCNRHDESGSDYDESPSHRAGRVIRALSHEIARRRM